MKIKDGGATSNICGDKVENIIPRAIENYRFELWINDSLSYLSLEEMLQLRDIISTEIQKAVEKRF